MPFSFACLRFALGFLLTFSLAAQHVLVRPAPPRGMPVLVDSNSPLNWRDGELHVFTSTGTPLVTSAESQDNLEDGSPQEIVIRPESKNLPMWIESVWQDDDGTLYAWYHHEPQGMCANSFLTAPKIGALVSKDGGRTFQDLGIVLASGDPADCSYKNGFFAGGHGDFSVIPDREQRYFYFLFGNYGGDPATHGVAMARMAFEDRDKPVGAVWKYFSGDWNQPGLGGSITPLLPAVTGWHSANTDSYWGPSVHWNMALGSFVMLLNHACCTPQWPQEGIYIAFNHDLSNPAGWTAPAKILRTEELIFGAGYYPQVVGLGFGGTDTLAGQVSRLYVNGYSRWELVVVPPQPPPAEEPELEPAEEEETAGPPPPIEDPY
jgi:hypothetical protein